MYSKKRRLWHYLKRKPYDSRAHANYRACVQQWRRLVKQQQASTEEHIIEANNLGAFYKFVNKRISNKSKISVVESPAGVTLTADLDIANAFNDYFASVGVASNEYTPQFPALNVPQLATIDVTEHDVLAAINKLKANLSAGPDGLPPLFFKRVRNAIALPLTIIFEQLLYPKYGKQLLSSLCIKKDLPIRCLISDPSLLLCFMQAFGEAHH